MSEPKTPAEIKAWMTKRRNSLYEGAGIDVKKMQEMAAQFMKTKSPAIAKIAQDKVAEDIANYKEYTNMLLNRTRVNKQMQVKIPNSFSPTPGKDKYTDILSEMHEKTAQLLKHTIGDTTPVSSNSSLRGFVMDVKFIDPNLWQLHENIAPFVSSILKRLPTQKTSVRLMAIKAYVPGYYFDLPPGMYPTTPGANQQDINRTGRMPTFYAIEQRAFEVPSTGDEIGIQFPDKYRLDAGVYTGQIFNKANRGKPPLDIKNMFKGNSTKPLKSF